MAVEMKHLSLAAFTVAVAGSPVLSEPVSVSLPDYAFDFAAVGHEIEVHGTTSNIMDSLTADDYITISESD